MTLDIGKEGLSIMENEGYKAYLVGGCVRDYLLNIDINDQDITTNMPLDKISKLFDVIDNGSKLAGDWIKFIINGAKGI